MSFKMVTLLNQSSPRRQSSSASLVDDHEKRIEAELDQLQKDICRVGSNPGEPSVSFGELFDDEEAQQYYEALVGTLKCAKKRGIVTFKGQMLLKGMHDNVEISIMDADKRTISAGESSAEITRKSQIPSVERSPASTPLPKSVDRNHGESPFMRTPPRASPLRRTPPRGGERQALPPVRQTPPRPPPSFSRTPPRSDVKSSPGVQRFHARSQSLTFSPIRHTRNEHSSLKIPRIFSRERGHDEYTSDSEAEIKNRRVRRPSKSSGASSDSETEVTIRHSALQNRQFPLPSSWGDSVLGTRRSELRGSVSERWTKRSSVSRKKGSDDSNGTIECRSVALKGGRQSSGEGNSDVVNKENQGEKVKPQPRIENFRVTRKEGDFGGGSPSHVVASGSKLVNGKRQAMSLLERATSEKVIRSSASVRVDEEVEQLLRDIRRVGSNPGEPRVTFGELFDDDIVQNTYEALVGTLRSAKRQGLIRFKGQVLFKGVHDQVMIEIVNK